ncbi:MAG: tetratricopeptide repeat protein [Bacteroidales bacterium]
MNILLMVVVLLFSSCSVKKNSSASRAYHNLTTRYNVFFNANEEFKKGLKSMESSFVDDYTEFLPAHPVYSLAGEGKSPVGGFDVTIEKCQKAIQLHSIRRAPQRGKYSSRTARERDKIEEFNPFLHRAWMLMGQAQFYKCDFLGAVSTFGYVIKHFRNLPQTIIESRLWTVRAYLAMGWDFDAQSALSHLNGVKIPESLNYLNNLVNAEYALAKGDRKGAVDLLEKIQIEEKSKTQRYRIAFLRAQIYSELGDNYKAQKAYDKVVKSSPPYLVSFNAKLQHSVVNGSVAVDKKIRRLNKMSRNPKNKDMLDRLYLAIGNIHLSSGDTIAAVKSFAKGVELSTSGGVNKALVALRLADIQYERREYAKSQPYYMEAHSQLPRTHSEFNRVEQRAEVLSELIVPFNSVQLQDSLQYLASLTPDERVTIIERIIDEVKKKEREEAEMQQKEEYESKKEEFDDGFGSPSSSTTVTPPVVSGDKSWYFYNSQLIASGKSEFQKRWGNRKLEDDWRRRNKSNFIFETTEESLDDQEYANESIDIDEDISQQSQLVQSSDPKDVNFYLQDIPLTSEAMAESDTILMNSLYQLGGIYKNRIEDYPLARETFERIEKRWPMNVHSLGIWYEMFLMSQREGDGSRADLYKGLILSNYPTSKLARAISDPNFVQNFIASQEEVNVLYSETFEAYSKGSMDIVIANSQRALEEFSLSKLTPNFRFLSAMASLSLGRKEEFKNTLRALVDENPEAELTQIAGAMLKGLSEGRELNSSGSLRAANIWNRALFIDGGQIELESDSLYFTVDPLAKHRVVLLFNETEVNKNLLLYEVARFNFRNFVVRDYDIDHLTIDSELGLLYVSPFSTIDEAIRYEKLFLVDGGLDKTIPFGIKVLVISDDNYQTLMRGKSINEYEQFFRENFAIEPN